MKIKELSKAYRFCKIDNEKKFVYEYCVHYWRRRRENLSAIYDLIIFYFIHSIAIGLLCFITIFILIIAYIIRGI